MDRVMERMLQESKKKQAKEIAVTIQIREDDYAVLNSKATQVDVPVEKLIVEYLVDSGAFKVVKKIGAKKTKKNPENKVAE